MSTIEPEIPLERIVNPGDTLHGEEPVTPKPKRRFSIGLAVAWIVTIAFMFVTLFPFYWMVRTAFSNGAVLATEPSSLLPVDFTLGAFKRVLGLGTVEEAQAQGGSGASVNFWLSLRNSIIIATVITIGQTLFCAMAAYAFSRLRWPGRDVVFGLFLAALFVPPIFVSLPNFILINSLGLLNTLPGIILPFLFMTPFAVFFLRQFFLGISQEVEEAARIDGASNARIFFKLIVPMSSAPITTLAILTFIASWNEYLWPLLIAKDESAQPLTLALGIFRSQTPGGSPDWPGLMAMTLLTALPIIILFIIFGRRVVNSIQFSGIK
jgi:multiple sugar transport system permease protein